MIIQGGTLRTVWCLPNLPVAFKKIISKVQGGKAAGKRDSNHLQNVPPGSGLWISSALFTLISVGCLWPCLCVCVYVGAFDDDGLAHYQQRSPGQVWV